MARFLYSFPDDLAGHRLSVTGDIPPTLLADYEDYVRALASLEPLKVKEDGTTLPHPIYLSDSAIHLRNEFEGEIDKRLASGGDLCTMSDWAGKLVGACVRVAGLLHVMNHIEEGQPWSFKLSGETMQKAIAFGRYCIEHARAAYSLAQLDPVEEGACKLLDWIKTNELYHFSGRDVQRKLHRFRQSSSLKEPPALLVDHGYLRPVTLSGKDNRTRQEYEVNPAVYLQLPVIPPTIPQPLIFDDQEDEKVEAPTTKAHQPIGMDNSEQTSAASAEVAIRTEDDIDEYGEWDLGIFHDE
jgi:hypothetical protein